MAILLAEVGERSDADRRAFDIRDKPDRVCPIADIADAYPTIERGLSCELLF